MLHPQSPEVLSGSFNFMRHTNVTARAWPLPCEDAVRGARASRNRAWRGSESPWRRRTRSGARPSKRCLRWRQAEARPSAVAADLGVVEIAALQSEVSTSSVSGVNGNNEVEVLTDVSSPTLNKGSNATEVVST
jgi:hypothetical protein